MPASSPGSLTDVAPDGVVVLRDGDGQEVAELGLYAGQAVPPPSTHEGVLWIREASEYQYELNAGIPRDGLTLGPSELFSPDRLHPGSGRLRTDNYVGALLLELCTKDGDRIAVGDIEIRPSKLDAETEFHWMLENIGEVAAELALQRFGPVTGDLSTDPAGRSAEARYQQFAFLQSAIESSEFTAAMGVIQSRPHRNWATFDEERRPGQGLRGSSRVARELMRPGRRTPAPDVPGGSLPWKLRADAHEETTDTPPNRFVRYALTGWRDLAQDVLIALESEKESGPRSRGLRDARRVLGTLDSWLLQEPLRTASPVSSLPLSNPVLQSRAGYRQVLRTFLLLTLTAKITWEGGEDVFGAGRQNAATLYELWCFIRLVSILSELCEEPLDIAELLGPSKSGLTLVLGGGKSVHVGGHATRLGRKLDLSLYFNRRFPPEESTLDGDRSWSRLMRPDCSLRVAVDDESTMGAPPSVWIHFDAKYKATNLVEVLGTNEVSQAAKTEDLLKMHTYRDAIPRSVGSYVLYPGNQPSQLGPHRPTSRETLPGLGAFCVRPTNTDSPQDMEALRGFISQAIDHVSNQASRDERARYWVARAYRSEADPPPSPSAPFLNAPPADTKVLLGYVKSNRHLEWVLESRLYNLRADADRRGTVGVDGEELSTNLVLLYGPGASSNTTLLRVRDDEPVAVRRSEELVGYPNPGGSLYFCLPVGPLADSGTLPTVDGRQVAKLAAKLNRGGAARGAPAVGTWLDVLRVAAGDSSHPEQGTL